MPLEGIQGSVQGDKKTRRWCSVSKSAPCPAGGSESAQWKALRGKASNPNPSGQFGEGLAFLPSLLLRSHFAQNNLRVPDAHLGRLIPDPHGSILPHDVTSLARSLGRKGLLLPRGCTFSSPQSLPQTLGWSRPEGCSPLSSTLTRTPPLQSPGAAAQHQRQPGADITPDPTSTSTHTWMFT